MHMRHWDLSVDLDPAGELPLFLQLAGAIADGIRHGRLRAGTPLPGTRDLARRLGVNRNTVIAGYDELAAEGLVSARGGGGTFVAATAIAPVPRAQAAEDEPTYALPPPVSPVAATARSPAPGALLLSSGRPDARLFPARALARAFRRTIERGGRSLPGQEECCGHPRLRRELASMLASTRALPVTPANLMVTRSVEQAIDLVARALIVPGDVVAVEAFGYPPAWSVLRLAGARLRPIALDNDGLDVDALESVLAAQRLRAVFLTPHHQFPTTSVMSPLRRARLAELAIRHRFAIIEDDYDHEFHYAGKPVLPIAAGADGANVVYIGSLACLLAPGVGTAFVTAPASVFARLARLRAACDARSDAVMEGAVAELFEDGELSRHMRRMRRVCALRRDAFVLALERHLGSALRFRVPEGGMALWARTDEGIDLAAWTQAGEQEGVWFRSADAYAFQPHPASFMRLGFSALDEAELDDAARRMARALARSGNTRARDGAPARMRATGTPALRPNASGAGRDMHASRTAAGQPRRSARGTTPARAR